MAANIETGFPTNPLAVKPLWEEVLPQATVQPSSSSQGDVIDLSGPQVFVKIPVLCLGHLLLLLSCTPALDASPTPPTTPDILRAHLSPTAPHTPPPG